MNTSRLTSVATQNISDILEHSIKHDAPAKALVIYDTDFGLTEILTEGYRRALPSANFVDFWALDKEKVLELFDNLSAGDLVILVQSSNFRLNDFRIRLYLFEKKLKVIEHMHLYRNDEAVWDVYIDSLAYDKERYLSMGAKLKTKLMSAKRVVIESKGKKLVVEGGVEEPKLNVGDYTDMQNVGGTFPIGEVFTEARDFTNMNGSVFIYSYAESDFTIGMHEPFEIFIEKGIVTRYGEGTPSSFKEILAHVSESERPLVREIGFGLNSAITKERPLGDITAFERILGMHFSLGEKHGVYKKEGISTSKARFHIDIFPVVDKVYLDDEIIFADGIYILN